MSLDSICYLNASCKPGIRRLIETRVRKGELVPVEIEGARNQEHWATPQTLEVAATTAEEMVHILSPFDPLIHQRKRLQRRARARLAGISRTEAIRP